MTDQKSQGKQFSEVLVNLKGVHGSGTATRPSFMSLYVQLPRAERWEGAEGLYLFRRPERGDFIEPKNVLDNDMRDAILKLERRGEETRQRFELDHGHETWFQKWQSMPESAPATEVADQEDTGLW
jgi:ATP-dependent DNA helicase PIF1